MDTRTAPSRCHGECCVCGTSGQNCGFTALSDILPSDECNITETITSALGVQISPSQDSVICEACHLKIFNFKTFAIECNRKRDLLRQRNCANTVNANNFETYENVEQPRPVFETPTDIATRTATCNPPIHLDQQTLIGGKNISESQPVPNRNVEAQCRPQANTVSKLVTSLSPFTLPTGTVMLKKETSSVYILPNGTTVEFLDQSNTSGNNPIRTVHQRQTISLPSASTVQNNQTQNDLFAALPTVFSSKPKPKRVGVKSTMSSVPYTKPTVILTDAVPIPTLLLPKRSMITTPSPHPPMPIKTNSAGKVAIPKIQPCVQPRLPPMLLPKVGADIPSLRCPMCNIFFIKKTDLKAHLLAHPEAKLCGICEQAFPNDSKLISHMREVHPELVCPVAGCNFLAPSTQALNHHATTHTDPRRYQCTVCGKKFKKLAYLRFHKKQHSADRQTFKCHLCEKLFKSKFSLGYHLKFHKTGHSKCPKCDKKFQFKESLLRHLAAMHSENAPFACEICNQKCADQQSKIYHMKTHDKEKNKTEHCPVVGCDFRDFYQYRIRRHVQRVHEKAGPPSDENKPTKCPFCGLEVSVMGDHLSEEGCKVQGLIHEVLNRPSQHDGDTTPNTNCNRQDAENVLQKYREQLTTSEDRNDLDSLSRNEFFEDLVKTIKKLRERLNHKEVDSATADAEMTDETVNTEAQSSSISKNVDEYCEDDYMHDNNFESRPVSNLENEPPPNEERGERLTVLHEPSSTANPAEVQYVLPPSGTDPNQEVQYQEVVTSSGGDTYQEIIVEGDNVTEDMVKMVETAIQNGVFESGTSFIIVDKSTCEQSE